jgi:hypothetical protein
MQREWDKRRERQVKEYDLQRRTYEDNRNFSIQMRDQAMQEAEFQMKQEEFAANQKIEFERRSQGAKILEGINGLDPKSPNYQDEVNKIIAANPMGITDKTVAGTLARFDAVNEIYRENIKTQQEAQRETEKSMTEVAEVAEQLGLTDLTGLVKTVDGVDVIKWEELGRAKGKLKRKTEEPTIGGKSQQDIESIITSVEADIAEAEGTGDDTRAEGLKRKLEYYRGLTTKDVDTATSSYYIPKEKREVGKVYQTSKGNFEWTGTGWKPAR